MQKLPAPCANPAPNPEHSNFFREYFTFFWTSFQKSCKVTLLKNSKQRFGWLLSGRSPRVNRVHFQKGSLPHARLSDRPGFRSHGHLAGSCCCLAEIPQARRPVTSSFPPAPLATSGQTRWKGRAGDSLPQSLRQSLKPARENSINPPPGRSRSALSKLKGYENGQPFSGQLFPVHSERSVSAGSTAAARRAGR